MSPFGLSTYRGIVSSAFVPLPALDGLDDAACAAALAPLFEGAPRFLARLAAARPFGDAADLFARAREIAHAMPEPEQVELIDAHPRLGAPPGSVSALSFREQGYDTEAADAAAEAERARVAAELDAPERGVRGRSSGSAAACSSRAGRAPALLPELEAALAADRHAELHRALDAVVDIAADRYRTLAGTP